jgi:hypothetical protein
MARHSAGSGLPVSQSQYYSCVVTTTVKAFTSPLPLLVPTATPHVVVTDRSSIGKRTGEGQRTVMTRATQAHPQTRSLRPLREPPLVSERTQLGVATAGVSSIETVSGWAAMVPPPRPTRLVVLVRSPGAGSASR